MDEPRIQLIRSSKCESIEHSTDLESVDELRVRKALAKIDPRVVLEQLSSPCPPKWRTVISDSISIKVPLSLFNEWSREERGDRENIFFEYNYSTE